MARLWRRLMFLIRRKRFERDLDDEIRFHLDMKVRAAGGTPEAGYATRRHFGNTTLLREQSRDQWGWVWLETLLQDLRYGVRMLVNHPSFTLIAVLTLAVGIGVNTAIFTAFNAIALRPLDVPDPRRVVDFGRSGRNDGFSFPDYQHLRDHSHAFSGLMAWTSSNYLMRGVPAFKPKQQGSGIADAVGLNFGQPIMGKDAEPVFGVLVSGNFFRVLGVAPVVGRDFVAGEDDKPGAPPVLLLSENFWERRFGRDPAAIGRTIILNDVAFTVIGISPWDFAGTMPLVPSFWAPIEQNDRLRPGGDSLHDPSQIYGRLAKGVTLAQAQAEADALYQGLENEHRDPNAHQKDRPDHIVLRVASPFGNTEGLNQPVVLILAAVSMVLLIACANVASLLLARAAARQKEIAIRLAIGASRGRLVRQLMTESALISILAGASGLALAWWVLHLLMVEISDSISGLWVRVALHLAPDHRVFAYMLLVSIAAAIGFGLAPALQVSKPALTSALKEEAASFGGLRKSRLRDVLVCVQVALSLILLIGAGLLARGSQRVFGIDLGFDYRRLVTFHVVGRENRDAATARAMQRRIIDRIEAIAGVQAVGVTSHAPLIGAGWKILIGLDGRPIDAQHAPEANYTLVTPNYFETLGVPIVRGRNFTSQEARDGHDVDGAPVIISARTAQSFWPGQNPIGRRISFEVPASSFGDRWVRSRSSVVIGVVKDVRTVNLQEEDDTCLYIPVTRDYAGSVLVRTAGDPRPVVAALLRELPETDPNLEGDIFDFRSGLSLQPSFFFSRVAAVMATLIGFLGLVMASVGIYGMVSFAVTQRTHEVGIRMALGARREDVLTLVLGQSMRPVLIGIAVGIAAAAGAARVLVSLLFGLSTFDPPTFLVVSTILAAVALLAGYIPARRAMKVDPMVALRYE